MFCLSTSKHLDFTGFFILCSSSSEATLRLVLKHIKATTASYSNKKDRTVYVTETGSKYHRAGCRYLWHSKIPMKLSDAKNSYSPCSVCNP